MKIWENKKCCGNASIPFSYSRLQIGCSRLVVRELHFYFWCDHFNVLPVEMICVYVIAWARGQLRINFTSIFKSFHKIARVAKRRKTLKIQVKLILNCTRALAIACLSHAGPNFVQRTTFKVLLSRKQVCRLSLKTGYSSSTGKAC